MTPDPFLTCLDFTLKREGGYVDNPNDKGGPTNKGITLKTLRRHVPDATVDDLKRISDAMVMTIYRTDYWNPVKGALLPPGLDLMVFDMAVTSGPGTSVRLLQTCVGAASDGAIGPKTLAAIKTAPADQTLIRLALRQSWFYGNLADAVHFGDGWTNRLVDRTCTAWTRLLTGP